MRVSAHLNRPHTLLVACFATAALWLLPATAQAASVAVSGGKLTYTAAPGEANRVTVAPWGLSLRITDTGSGGAGALTLTSGIGCWRLSAISAACSGNVSGLSASLGDGDDTFDGKLARVDTGVSGGSGDDTLSTGYGADTIEGGAGADALSGRAGNDTFTARDGEADTLICGDGEDGGEADLADGVAGDCEAVLPPQVAPGPGAQPDPGTDPNPDPGNGPGPGTDPDPDPGKDPGTDPGTDPGSDPSGKPNAVPPTIPAQTVLVSASGVALVRIVCPADSGGCRGTVALVLPPATNARRGKIAAAGVPRGNSLALGKTRFKAKAGTSPLVRVRLSKRGRQRILRGRRSRARIVVTTRSADGKSVVSTQDVPISLRRQPRARHRKAKG
jgi:hemolysin type calcium-binding protein